MITKIEKKFVLQIEENNYYFDGDEYENTLLFLTNPNIELPNEVMVDSSIEDEDDKYIMNTYKDFINSFIIKRNTTNLLFKRDDDNTEKNNAN